MTYTAVQYKSYADYLEADLGSDGNYRLLSNGEIVELPPEDEENICIGGELSYLLKQVVVPRRLVRTDATEIQVRPVGDGRVNRKPDVVVLRPEHIELMATIKKSTVLFDMPAPILVAEVVSVGSESSDNCLRDYEWKRKQYQERKIPEYWIIDRHREKITVLMLNNTIYTEEIYRGTTRIRSAAFPSLNLSAKEVLRGGL